jgi:hypothetical protein
VHCGTPVTTPSFASIRPVPHVVGERAETIEEELSIGGFQVVFGERALHTPDPFVPLDNADRERQVSHSQARMAVAFDIDRRSAGPAGEEEEQLFSRSLQARGVKATDRRRRGLGVHDVVEPVHEPANSGLATEYRIVRTCLLLHRANAIL